MAPPPTLVWPIAEFEMNSESVIVIVAVECEMNIAPPLDLVCAWLFLNEVLVTLNSVICWVNIAPPPKLSLPVAMLFSNTEFSIMMLQQKHGTVEYDEVVLHSSLLDMQEEDTIYLTEESNNSFVFLHYAVKGTGMALYKGRRMVEKLYAEGLMFRVGVGRCRIFLSDIRESMLESILALDLAPEQNVAIFEQLTVVYPQNNFVM